MQTSAPKIKIAAIAIIAIIAVKMVGSKHESYTPKHQSNSSIIEASNVEPIKQVNNNQEPTITDEEAVAAILILAALAQNNQTSQGFQEPSNYNNNSNSGSYSQLDIHDVVSTELATNIIYE